ncbi:hypothetical protein H4S02_003366 [Coemansia sp. RSA 2611]|nr:hypothetical protein H4S02_003366 [Coemansia sp. RSA 2611]
MASLPALLWASACSAWRWASARPSSAPPQYPALAYGYLPRGPLSLCSPPVAPPGLHLRRPLALTDARPRFTAVGTHRQICALLRTLPMPIFCSARAPTSHLVIELHRACSRPLRDDLREACQARALACVARVAACLARRLLACVFSRRRQLVIRAECEPAGTDALPLLSVRAPQGLMLSEVAPLLDGVRVGSVDLTRDKALNIRVIGRSRSLSWIEDDACGDCDPLFLLPPYQLHSTTDLPPAYSLCA